MGERIAIRFVRKTGTFGACKLQYPEEKSVVMYSHNGGIDHLLRNLAQAWVRNLPNTDSMNGSGPLDRREVNALILEFLRDSEYSYTVDRLYPDMNGLYLDWGSWEIDVFTGKAKKVNR